MPGANLQKRVEPPQVLFVFWELTSLTSCILIGFNHESENSRKLALQGLFITVGGGLLLMTGFNCYWRHWCLCSQYRLAPLTGPSHAHACHDKVGRLRHYVNHGRAGYLSGVKLWSNTERDDLKDYYQEDKKHTDKDAS